MGPKLLASLGASCELGSPPLEYLLTRLEFRPIEELPVQSQICVLGGVLAILDLDELASRPGTDELMAQSDADELASRLSTDELAIQPDTNESTAVHKTSELTVRSDTNGTSLVMTVGRHLLILVGRYVLYIIYVHSKYIDYSRLLSVVCRSVIK